MTSESGNSEMAASAMFAQLLAEQRRLAEEIAQIRNLCITILNQTVKAPDTLPIPSAELHALVSGNNELNVVDFFEIGRACVESVKSLAAAHGRQIDSLQAILDFGCGCGRMLRHLHGLKHTKVYGTDYNPRLAEWCRNNLPFAEIGLNGLEPPLSYADGTFDLVYSFSVFTHLPEPLQHAWIAEIRRVLGSGGDLLFTAHGRAHAQFYLPQADQDHLASNGFFILNESSSGKNECGAFHTESYVRNVLAKGFEVLAYIPGQIVNADRKLIGQDVYYLRKVG